MKVWMNGCFDVLHHAHFKMIEFAKSFGGELVIGIDTDRRVKFLKDDTRPFHTDEERKFNLLSIKGVDRVIIYDTAEELCELIKTEAPDIFVIGSDYRGKPIVGEENVKEIRYFERVEQFSTTKILKNEKENISDWRIIH